MAQGAVLGMSGSNVLTSCTADKRLTKLGLGTLLFKTGTTIDLYDLEVATGIMSSDVALASLKSLDVHGKDAKAFFGSSAAVGALDNIEVSNRGTLVMGCILSSANGKLVVKNPGSNATFTGDVTLKSLDVDNGAEVSIELNATITNFNTEDGSTVTIGNGHPGLLALELRAKFHETAEMGA